MTYIFVSPISSFKFLKMTSKNLMIQCIESTYTAEYIANVLWNQHIARVSNITLIPYLKNTEIYNLAYISVDEWCESETAYNFVQRIYSSNKEARLVHQDDDWWPVELNTHNNGNIVVGDYTTSFNKDYFFKKSFLNETPMVISNDIDEEEEFYVANSEMWFDFVSSHPIRGILNDFYTDVEALDHIWSLNNDLNKAENERERKDIEYEIKHFEMELRIHKSVNNSTNVTIRNVENPQMEGYNLGKLKCC